MQWRYASSQICQKAPLIIAQEIIEQIENEDIFYKLEVAKPGFINISLSNKFLAAITDKFLNSSKFGVQGNTKPKK